MPKKCKINLALQGGGSFGAFSWGVLDRLLEANCLGVEAISGASSGALNAAVFITGYEKAGAAGARAALESFWRDVSCLAPGLGYAKVAMSFFPSTLKWVSKIFSSGYLSQTNPLRALIEAHVDCNLLKRGGIKCFIAATHVNTGLPRIFDMKDVSTDALLASACLPQMSSAVEIDGEYYWDGGYSSNPPLLSFVQECKSRDVLLVQLNAGHTAKIPKTQSEVADRSAELLFNAPLLAELNALKLALKDEQSICLHRILTPTAMHKFSMLDRLDTNANMILELKRLGREAAERWLVHGLAEIGVESFREVAA